MKRGRRRSNRKNDDAIAGSVHMLVFWGYPQLGGRWGACRSVGAAAQELWGRSIGESGVEKIYKTWLTADDAGIPRRIASRFTAESRKRNRPTGGVHLLARQLLAGSGHWGSKLDPASMFMRASIQNERLELTRGAQEELALMPRLARNRSNFRQYASSRLYRNCVICRFRTRTAAKKK